MWIPATEENYQECSSHEDKRKNNPEIKNKVEQELTPPFKRLRVGPLAPVPPPPPRRSRMTRRTSPPTWEQLKKLTMKAEAMVPCQGAQRTAKTLFLAMLSILAVQVCDAQTPYWAYIPDPPFLRAVTWDDPSIPVFVNDTDIMGQSSADFLTPQWVGDYRYEGRSTRVPICFTAIKYWNNCLTVEPSPRYTHGISRGGDPEEYEGWIGREWFLTIYGLPDITHTVSQGVPPKLPPCVYNEYRLFLKYPPWRHCRHELAVVHTPINNSFQLLDWSYPNPLSSRSSFKARETPGGWVEEILTTKRGGIQLEIFKLMAALGSISLHHDNLTVITGLTACVPPPYRLLIGIIDIVLKDNLYTISCTHCNLSNCVSRYNFDYEVVVLHQPSFVMLPVNISGPWYRDTGSQVLRELNELLSRPKRFIGMLIAGLVALVSLIATATTAAIALTQEIHTAHFVDSLAKNVLDALGAQELIDKKIEQRLNALEEAVLLIGNQMHSLKVRSTLQCHAEFDWICVTPKIYNGTMWHWDRVRNHLLGVWDQTNFTLDISRLHGEIQAISDAGSALLPPSEVAQNIFNEIQSLMSFHGLQSFIWSLLTVVILALIILCLLPVCFRTIGSSI
ncbi:endogenous retrovirus group K member 113 Env polyprotein-like [Myotis daubentonii]|uniref:endogenous retrovirus group K member 113 Env polyprotein-like n=1 Tax=Myotis daubentonii TaxID=98922 RepID=UPI002873E086|nr:endogenous retrovirus group K member 113 Env polyprotein-like [Myotis daubentonii]